MKNSIKLIIILAIFFGSCTKADEKDQKNVGTLTLPIASFYYTGSENPAPVTITFHNTSQYSDEFLWTFHNGATSTAYSPTFTYPASNEDKSYIVKLKATDSNTGESNTRSKSILILSSK